MANNAQILKFTLAAGDTTTNWRRMLSVTNENTRSIHGVLTSGDSIKIQFSNDDIDNDKSKSETTNTTTNFASSVSQTTTPFELGYDGNFKWVRIVKTGAAGAATIFVEA